jgi:adenine-specific DNA-methyltransferase
VKYMGGKGHLLRGLLGSEIRRAVRSSARFVDFFSGSGVVSHYVASKFCLPVLSVDLQEYGRALAAAVIERDFRLEPAWFEEAWILPTRHSLKSDVRSEDWARLSRPQGSPAVLECRRLCEQESDSSERLLRSYGGHYYSPLQALVIQKLWDNLPSTNRDVALATLIWCASRCAASPGHTAQPFQPTTALLPHIHSAWNRDPLLEVSNRIRVLSNMYARVVGMAIVADACSLTPEVTAGDLVFIDPPYSDVQYSRFYHVLEGIASGGFDEVFGAGRSPLRINRATSILSFKSLAERTLNELLERVLDHGAAAIVTLPEMTTTNGLSGLQLVKSFRKSAVVSYRRAESLHSTLGGPAESRGARRAIREMVISIRPR